MLLNLFGKEVESVFALNGNDENSVTYALGWSLSQSSALLAALGENLFGETIEFDDARVDLQRASQDLGFTDVEIVSPSVAHIIIEAKRYRDLPGTAQLKKYATRIGKETGRGGLIVSLSAASQEYAADKLPNELGGARLDCTSTSVMTRRTSKDGLRAASWRFNYAWRASSSDRHAGLSLHQEEEQQQAACHTAAIPPSPRPPMKTVGGSA